MSCLTIGCSGRRFAPPLNQGVTDEFKEAMFACSHNKKFQKTDAEDLVNVVHCAFVDWKNAQAADTERTLINTNCDLFKPEITVRFYLGDDGPISGTNHVNTRMSEPFTFCFE